VETKDGQDGNGERKHYEGRLVECGTPHKLLTRPEDSFAASLMAVPRKQADQVEELAAGQLEGGRRE
jgi:hypothetical protein